MSLSGLSVLCLVNWDIPLPVTDDGSHDNWLEGTAMLEAAIEALPIDVLHVDTLADELADERLRPGEAIERLRASTRERAFIAGNFTEIDVLPLASAMVEAGIEPIVLFDVCGMKDPAAKWQALARAVDEGAKVSTVQQTLIMMTADSPDPAMPARARAILAGGYAEDAHELSAA